MKVYVAGHRGLVGSEVNENLKKAGHETVFATRDDMDLTNRDAVFEFMQIQKPDAVVIAAAVVGGIRANMERPVDFLSKNLQIQTNLIDACHEVAVEKVIFLGSSCIYPKYAEQPISEKSLLTGPLEPTNEAYAIAKIAGVKLIKSYNQQFGHKWVSLMPTNVYGSRDNFLDDDSHVMPALIRKISAAQNSDAKQVELWGTGAPLREFIHASDLASAITHVLEQMPINEDLINVGTGDEVSINQLAELIASKLGFEGEITYDSSMPDGTPRKVVDSSILRNLGWKPRVPLEEGISRLLAKD